MEQYIESSEALGLLCYNSAMRTRHTFCRRTVTQTGAIAATDTQARSQKPEGKADLKLLLTSIPASQLVSFDPYTHTHVAAESLADAVSDALVFLVDVHRNHLRANHTSVFVDVTVWMEQHTKSTVRNYRLTENVGARQPHVAAISGVG